jgi:hypothetical protein
VCFTSGMVVARRRRSSSEPSLCTSNSGLRSASERALANLALELTAANMAAVTAARHRDAPPQLNAGVGRGGALLSPSVLHPIEIDVECGRASLKDVTLSHVGNPPSNRFTRLDQARIKRTQSKYDPGAGGPQQGERLPKLLRRFTRNLVRDHRRVIQPLTTQEENGSVPTVQEQERARVGHFMCAQIDDSNVKLLDSFPLLEQQRFAFVARCGQECRWQQPLVPPSPRPLVDALTEGRIWLDQCACECHSALPIVGCPASKLVAAVG